MSDGEDDVPLRPVIRVVRRDDPVSAVIEVDAQRRVAQYAELRLGAPVFGHAEDLGDQRWLVRKVQDEWPQGARDTLRHGFRMRASETDDEALAAQLLAAERTLGWEKVDELTVGGHRYRIVRVQTAVRFGPDGPESPRPSDPDPLPAGEAHKADRFNDVVSDPSRPVSPVEAQLTIELLPANYSRQGIPADVYADSRRAVETHPAGVLLPTRYTVAEHVDGRWRQATSAHATPQSARDSITFRLRYLIPKLEDPSEDELAAYARAADELDATRADEIEVLNLRFRVVRVESLLRFGPDGPEPPRPSDHDPEPPEEVHIKQLRDEGLLDEEPAD